MIAFAWSLWLKGVVFGIGLTLLAFIIAAALYNRFGPDVWKP